MVKNPLPVQEMQGLGLIPGPGRSHRGGNGNSLQYSSLENPVDRGASQAAVHGVAESDTNACVHTHTHKHDTRPSVHRRGSHSLFHLLLHCSRPCSALGTHSLMYLEYSPGGGVPSRGRGAVPGQGCSPGGGVQSRGRGAVPGEGWGRTTAASVAGSCPLNPVVRFHMLLISLDKHPSIADQPLFSDG